MITIKQIEAVYWVQALGSYHAAAEKLHATQSAISKRITELECLLGITIFDKKIRTRLTTEGRGLMSDFSEMLSLRASITNRVQDPASYTGTFRLGVTELVALTWLPALIALIKQSYPRMVIQSKVDRARNLWQQVNTSQTDLVICPWMGEHNNALSKTALGSMDYAWMINRTLLGKTRETYAFEEIMQFPLLTHSEDSILHRLLEQVSSTKKTEPREKIFCGSLIALAELAKASLGIACLPNSYFSDYAAQNGLTVIQTDFSLPSVDYFAVCSSDKISDHIVEMARVCCDFTGGRCHERPRDQPVQLGSDDLEGITGPEHGAHLHTKTAHLLGGNLVQ